LKFVQIKAQVFFKEGIEVCSNKGPGLLQRGDNQKI
jgi:hypothetical protein